MKYDDIKRVIMFILIIPFLPLLGIFGLFRLIFVDFWGYVKQVNKNVDVKKNGISSSGKVITLSQTGMFDADNPVCRLQVVYLTQEGEEVTADAVESIKITDMPAFQAGNYVAIKYNPNKKTEIAIDYY